MEKSVFQIQENKKRLAQIVSPLLEWYDEQARVLPWREDPQPYHVWVSEIMLQQTRVEAVKEYYKRFLQQLPTIADLAYAPEEQILKLWQGLGYYNRVRNLQKGARIVMEQYGGNIPASFVELRKLPGIGEYTAGAIASIAFGIPVSAVDGNVLRVISRILASYGDITDNKVKKEVKNLIEQILPVGRVGDFNQSLMDLGAMICVPNGMPKCEECPVSALCLANKQGVASELPKKTGPKPRKLEEKTIFILVCGQKLAIRKRTEKGLLSGLWELPSQDGFLDEKQAEKCLENWGLLVNSLEASVSSKHIFTHIEWDMNAWIAKIEQESTCFLWADAEQLKEKYTLPYAFKAYFKEIEKQLKSVDTRK